MLTVNAASAIPKYTSGEKEKKRKERRGLCRAKLSIQLVADPSVPFVKTYHNMYVPRFGRLEAMNRHPATDERQLQRYLVFLGGNGAIRESALNEDMYSPRSPERVVRLGTEKSKNGVVEEVVAPFDAIHLDLRSCRFRFVV